MGEFKISLKEFEIQFYKCQRCGKCRVVCPTYEEVGWESISARGRILLAQAFLKGDLPPTKRLIDSMYLCTTCKFCEEVCPADVKLIEIGEAGRADLYRLKKIPEGYFKLLQNIFTTDNPFGFDPSTRTEFIQKVGLQEKKADVLFYVGCMASSVRRLARVANKTIDLLKSMNINFTTLGNQEVCCGEPLLCAGAKPEFEKQAEKNLKLFQKVGVKEIITACPACFEVFKNYYPKIFGKMDFNVHHILEVLAERIRKGSVEFKKEVNMKITYHDSCHLGRRMQLYELPREIIRSLPGVELVEMKLSKENSMCCGGGGGLNVAFPEVAHSIAKKRVKDALETGVEAIVTDCPTCEFILSHAIVEDKLKIRILSLVELVSSAEPVFQAD